MKIKLEGCGLNIDYLHVSVLVGMLGQDLGELDSCSHELVALFWDDDDNVLLFTQRDYQYQ